MLKSIYKPFYGSLWLFNSFSKKFSQYDNLEIRANIEKKFEIFLYGKSLKTPSKNPLKCLIFLFITKYMSCYAN